MKKEKGLIMKKELTRQMKFYIVKFLLRITAFSIVLYFYIFHKQTLWEYVNTPFWKVVTPIHVLWLCFMTIMILHIFPFDKLTMALLKSKKEKFVPVDNLDHYKLLKFVQDMNIKAWRVMLVWLLGNGVLGVLYLAGILEDVDLVMATVFFFICDYICILIFCPFQTFIMHNKCCVNCRIYDWGHFMMFTPMLFLRNFFSWSLFFTSCVVLIHWEIVYAKHPERFWEGTNKRLQCGNCKDKTCKLKINRVKPDKID
ncbi:MAG TPA: hypothetical protein DCW44_02160 [Eubacterium sp.]|nr:hypothetical protein [Eubacterium sp.]